MLTFLLACLDVRAEDGHWVTTWAAAPYATSSGNLPPKLLAHNTLRQFVRVSNPGKLVRLQFSNAYGSLPVVINRAHIAMAAGSGSSTGEN